MEYYTNQIKIRELQTELEKCTTELNKWNVIVKIDKNLYQPWPPRRPTPIFYYKTWTESYGTISIFTDIILIEPIITFKPGWHFNKVIFDVCKFTLTFQNIDNFIPKNTLVYKEYVCTLELGKINLVDISDAST